VLTDQKNLFLLLLFVRQNFCQICLTVAAGIQPLLCDMFPAISSRCPFYLDSGLRSTVKCYYWICRQVWNKLYL